MNIKKINHIGIVVENLEQAFEIYRGCLGLEFLRIEMNAEFQCKIGFLQCGEVLIELIEPTGNGPSQKFLQEHGEGLHHICYEVDDIQNALNIAKTNKMTEYNSYKNGAGDSKVFFLDSDCVCSVETEFVELRSK